MKNLVICLSLFMLFLASCQKDENFSEYYFEAEVLERNPDCRIFAIKILEGKEKAEKIVGYKSSDGIFLAKNLPKELEISGLKIVLHLRKPQDEELSPCTNMGISYPWLWVESAEKK